MSDCRPASNSVPARLWRFAPPLRIRGDTRPHTARKAKSTLKTPRKKCIRMPRLWHRTSRECSGQSQLQQQPETMAALKGHGFIRTAEIGKRPGASAPERCLLLPTKTIPRGPKPVSLAPTFPARINPCPFKAKSSHILKCDCPARMLLCSIDSPRRLRGAAFPATASPPDIAQTTPSPAAARRGCAPGL